MRLAERAVDGRGRSFAASMRTYQVAAAARRNASIATVRVATDLTEAEREPARRRRWDGSTAGTSS